MSSKFGTPLIEQTHFAIEDEAGPQLLERLDDFRIRSGRILLLASQQLVAIREDAISVVLELEDSALA